MSTNKETKKKAKGAKKKNTTITAPDACLDISLVQELYEQLQQALEADLPIVIDTAQVERIDTAVLQILCAFSHDAKTKGLTVQWHQPSQALQHAARLLDLDACLDLPTDEAAITTIGSGATA